MPFTSLGLSKALLLMLKKLHFQNPYPIQTEAIPAILNKRDILGIAQTGSGKTASYVLPLLMNLQEKSLTKDRNIDALVIVPTRELAVQVNEVFQTFLPAAATDLKSYAVFGGVSINPQMKNLRGINILIATPGRLLELVRLNALSLSSISTFILDEADKLLNLGFKNEMEEIFSLLPKIRHNLLFSATLNKDISDLNQILNNPLIINIKAEAKSVDLINQSIYTVSEERKGPLLRYLIKTMEMKQVLVFTSSVARADRVADKLRRNGIDAQAIHRKKSQGARTDLLIKFKNGILPVLVTTDLLSRGIDIQFLPFVINYELPRSPKDFIHRIGRTGRAENPGKAITLITEKEQHHFKVIQKKMGKKVELSDSSEFNLQGY